MLRAEKSGGVSVFSAALARFITFAAAGAASCAALPQAARAAEERISLTQKNISDYARQSGGELTLAPGAAGAERNYIISQALNLSALTLNDAHTSLTLARRQKPRDEADAFYSHSLEIENGRLNISARAAGGGSGETPAVFYFEDSPDAASIPHFRQTGGETEIEAGDNATAIGGANFYALEGGGFHVRAADEATALRLCYTDLDTGEHDGRAVFFSQTGGESRFAAAGGGSALESNQSFELSGGRMDISAAGSARAIALTDAETQFVQKGGELSIQADGMSAGVAAGQFLMLGGTLSLQSGGSGKAVYITDILHEDYSASSGVFRFAGGALEISRNSAEPGGYALYGGKGSRAEFGAGSLLRPILDASAAGAPITGLMSFGSVRIAPGAELEFGIKNAGKIKTDAELSLDFLESREAPIEGVFSQSASAAAPLCGEKLFFSYRPEKSPDGKRYQLRLKPKNKGESGGGTVAPEPPPEPELKPEPKPEPEPKPKPKPQPALLVSDIMRGNNKRAAKAMENGMEAADGAAGQAIKALYDRFYNSGQGEEKAIKRGLRGLSPHQAVRLPALTLRGLSRFAAAAAGRAQEAPLQNFWLAPLSGRSIRRGQNSGFSRLRAEDSGLNFGAAGAAERGALALAGEVNFGKLSGAERYHANARHIFLGAAYQRPPPAAAHFTPQLDVSAAFGSSVYRQRRADPSGALSRAKIQQTSFFAGAAASRNYRLQNSGITAAPQIGAEYGFVRQNSWRERGSVLALAGGGAHYSALSVKLGANFQRAGSRFSLSAAAFYHYAVLGSEANLGVHLRGASAVSWREKGERDGRLRAEFTARASYRFTRHISLSGLYSLFRQAKYCEDNFSLLMKIAF